VLPVSEYDRWPRSGRSDAVVARDLYSVNICCDMKLDLYYLVSKLGGCRPGVGQAPGIDGSRALWFDVLDRTDSARLN